VRFLGIDLWGGAQIFRFGRGAATVTLLTAFFAILYKGLPEIRIAWRDVWIGAAGTALLFVVGQALIGLYFKRSSPGSPYGAAGSLVVLLLWIYYQSQIFFLGAHFTHRYAQYAASSKANKPLAPPSARLSDDTPGTIGGPTPRPAQ
jgi:membrane protein